MPRKAKEYEYNELCSMFPSMSEERLKELADDILAEGQRDPIQLDGEGLILDGRSRYQACIYAGVVPVFQKWKGPRKQGEYIAYVISKNLKRRDLIPGVRAQLAVKFADLYKQGGDRKSHSFKTPSRGFETTREIAKKADVDPKTVEKALKAKKVGGSEAEAAIISQTTTAAAVIKAATPEKPITDHYGHEVNGEVGVGWRQAHETVSKWKAAISKIAKEVTDALDQKPLNLGWLHRQEIELHLRNAARTFGLALPHCLCPECTNKDRRRPQCTACRTIGWMPAWRYKNQDEGLRWEDYEK
jgi:hypothetical protein